MLRISILFVAPLILLGFTAGQLSALKVLHARNCAAQLLEWLAAALERSAKHSPRAAYCLGLRSAGDRRRTTLSGRFGSDSGRDANGLAFDYRRHRQLQERQTPPAPNVLV